MGTSIPSRIEQGRRPGYNSNRGRQYGGSRNGVQAVANSNFPQNLQVRESQKAKRNKSPPSISSGSQSDSNDENDEPEAISSKLMPIKHLPPDDGTVPTPRAASADFQVVKKMHSEPRPPPKNPFASRPTLLRNVSSPLFCTWEHSLTELLIAAPSRNTGNDFKSLSSHSISGGQRFPTGCRTKARASS